MSAFASKLVQKIPKKQSDFLSKKQKFKARRKFLYETKFLTIICVSWKS